MKKRLLSAALALAMALTLLPMSVFAGTIDTTAKATESSPASGVTTVQYVYGTDYSKATGGGVAIKDAWAWQWTDTDGSVYGIANKTYWSSSNSLGGVVNGTGASGTWYADVNDLMNDTNTALRTTSFTLVGDMTLSSVGNSTSLSVNLFGKELTLGGLNTVNSLTITDTFHSTYGGTAGTVKGITRNVGTYTTGTPATTMSASALTLSITGAKVSGGINLVGRGNRVTLTDVEVDGAIVMDGTTAVITNGKTNTTYDAQNLTINPRTTFPVTPSIVSEAITVTGNASNVNLNGVTGTGGLGNATGAVTVNSTGGTVKIDNSACVGAITVKPAGTVTATSAPAVVTINDGSAAGVTYEFVSPSTAAGSVTVNAQGSLTGPIAMDSGTVTIHSANVKNITLKQGTLTMDGANGTAGDITLAESGKTTFNFSGTGWTVDKLAVDSGKGGNLTIGSNWPNGRVNTFKTLDLGTYTGQSIKGGIFGVAASDSSKRLWFNSDLQFMRKTADNLYAYYGTRELAAAIGDAGTAAKDDGTLTVIGASATNYVEFYNSMLDANSSTSNPVAKLGYGKSTGIYLPEKINGTPVATWTDLNNAKEYGINEEVPISIEASTIKLVIQGSGAAVSKLTNATSTGTNKNVTVTLSGNQITVSGAVGQDSYEDVKLTLTTDLIDNDGKPVTFDVLVSYNTTTKSSGFSTLGLPNPPLGVTVNSNTIVVGSNTYTLSTSGLAKPAANLKVAGITSGEYAYSSLTGTSIVPTVNVAGMGTVTRDALVQILSGGTFDWTNSPAMRQVVNQAMTTITANNTLENYVTAAQRAAWNLNNKGKTPSADDLNKTGYDTAVLEPYLALNVTAYNESGVMTATLVPSYRVVVVSTNIDYTGTNGVAKGKNNFTAEGYYIAQAGRALNTPITNLTGTGLDVGVTLKLDNNSTALPSGFDDCYMLQDDTYVYAPSDSGSYTITHGGKTGLGTIALNKTEAPVYLEHTVGGTTTTSYYKTLQAAIDDAEQGDKITVRAAYTGSGVINVTGTARIFTIETLGQTTITPANNNFTVGVDTTGHTYTVQLQKSVAAADGTVEVAVGTANNGYASTSTSKAKVGDKVTVSVAPNTGYQGSVSAKTNTGASVPVTNNGNNTFTFTVPAGATRVDVTPVFVATSGLPFTDVSTSDSFYNAVKWNYDNQYIQGTTATTFRPNNYLTRGQIVLILYRHAGSPTVSYTSYPYTDMPTYDAEMCRAIIWATNTAKIVEGYGNGLFGPGNNVRNQELAKILYLYNAYRGKAVGSTSVNLSSYFTDASSISSWAVPYVQWAVANGVMGPTTGKLFQPQLQLQRYQAAVDIYNYGLRFGA